MLISGIVVYAQTLNIGSYNIRMHSQADYAQGDGWSQRCNVMCDLIAYMSFDIFGAQEVCHDQLEDMLARLPQYDYVGVARDDGATQGEYSPIFYLKERFELLKNGTFWLSQTPDSVSYGWDAACRRVCSWGLFKDKYTKKKFWFFNTHMDHIGVKARQEGARLIMDKIQALCGKNDKIILTGDFNVDQTSTPYNTIINSGFMADACDLSPVKFVPSGTYNSFDVEHFSTQRIDHIFVSQIDVLRYGVITYHYWSTVSDKQDTKNTSTNVHLPSDHYPIQAIVKW